MSYEDAHKEPHFIEAYERHFKNLKPKRVLEIGVQGGGSLKIWEKMFPEAEIVGVDILEDCKKYEGGNIKIFIGDQHDVKFLETLGEFDIIIDDGGHTMTQQQVSLKTLMNQLSTPGIYVIEDLHTSYWRQFQDIEHTTVEELKGLVDDLHEYADRSARCEKKYGIENKYSLSEIHFYKGIVFLYKTCT
jgi:cephalosporin hydroxylase